MSTQDTPYLIDEVARQAFTQSTDRSWSVVAPAGVGKTRAIVERIVSLAEGSGARARLERLVVVTYTRKAAQEMQERVERCLKEAPFEIQKGLEAAFFGTIHSFCLKLIRECGPTLGLPPLRLMEQETVWWLRFLREAGLEADPLQEALGRYLNVSTLLRLGRTPLAAPKPPGPCPALEAQKLLSYEPKGRTARGVRASQEALALWLKGQKEIPVRRLPLPEYTLGDTTFRTLWEEAWAPLKAWLTQAAQAWVGPLSARYQAFCLQKGVLSYEAMVQTAAWILQQPKLRKRIQAQKLCVILDEAQDTDATQFEVLLGIASSQDKSSVPYVPEPGRFCMVGDPQQSIFGNRADVTTYLAIERSLCEHAALERLVFQVTFRCAGQIVSGINALFPEILKGQAGQQAAFVPLQARPEAPEGNLLKHDLRAPQEEELPTSTQERGELEAQALAQWIARRGLESFGIEEASQLALLAPRNAWLASLKKALEAEGLPCQLLSNHQTRGEDPLYACIAHTLCALTQPTHSFHHVQVLSSLLGCKDLELAAYVNAGHSLSSSTLPADAGPISEALSLLASWREAIEGQCPLAAWHILVPHLKPYLEPLAQETHLNDILEHITHTALDAQPHSLYDWAQALYESCKAPQAPPTPQAGHIQLLSCHKAKGLEWDVVLLPFLNRPLLQAHEPFPRIRMQAGTPQLELFKAAQCSRKEAYLSELERLLYVACTRARQSLILIDDKAFYPSGKSASSFAALLKASETNASYWDSLPAVPPGPLSRAARRPHISEPRVQAQPDWEQARRQAQGLPKIHTPSQWALQHVRTPAHKHQSPSSSTPDYGQWWHTLMEGLCWHSPVSSWDPSFQSALGTCPDPERAQAQWQRFVTSHLVRALRQHGKAFFAEYPLFVPTSPQSAWEGTVDLLVQTQRDTYWLIDWKTQRHPPRELDPQSAIYLQLQAYVQALSQVLPSPPQAFVYFSATGQCPALDVLAV